MRNFNLSSTSNSKNFLRFRNKNRKNSKFFLHRKKLKKQKKLLSRTTLRFSKFEKSHYRKFGYLGYDSKMKQKFFFYKKRLKQIKKKKLQELYLKSPKFKYIVQKLKVTKKTNSVLPKYRIKFIRVKNKNSLFLYNELKKKIKKNFKIRSATLANIRKNQKDIYIFKKLKKKADSKFYNLLGETWIERRKIKNIQPLVFNSGKSSYYNQLKHHGSTIIGNVENFQVSLVDPFIQRLMKNGRKNKAYRIFFRTLELLNKQKTKEKNPYIIFERAIINVTPYHIVKKQNYKSISTNTRQAIHWIFEEARKRIKKKEKPIHQKLADELLKAYGGKGIPFSKRIEADLASKSEFTRKDHKKLDPKEEKKERIRFR